MCEKAACVVTASRNLPDPSSLPFLHPPLPFRYDAIVEKVGPFILANRDAMQLFGKSKKNGTRDDGITVQDQIEKGMLEMMDKDRAVLATLQKKRDDSNSKLSAAVKEKYDEFANLAMRVGSGSTVGAKEKLAIIDDIEAIESDEGSTRLSIAKSSRRREAQAAPRSRHRSSSPAMGGGHHRSSSPSPAMGGGDSSAAAARRAAATKTRNSSSGRRARRTGATSARSSSEVAAGLAMQMRASAAVKVSLADKVDTDARLRDEAAKHAQKMQQQEFDLKAELARGEARAAAESLSHERSMAASSSAMQQGSGLAELKEDLATIAIMRASLESIGLGADSPQMQQNTQDALDVHAQMRAFHQTRKRKRGM